MTGFLADARGNVAVAFGLVAPVLLLFVGVAVDYGDLTRLKAELQNSADAAAIAGARTMLNDNGLGAAQQETNARQTADNYVAAKTPAAAKEIHASAATRQVVVKLAQYKELYFGGFFGAETSTVSVTGVAAFNPPDVACMLALGKTEPVGIELSGSGKVTASKCTMWANAGGATSLQSSGSATATARVVGAAGGASGTGFSPAPKTYGGTFADPFLNRYQSPDSTVCKYSEYIVKASGSATPMLPGVYCNGLKIQGDVTLSPGVYYIKDSVFEITGHPKITGTGVTIVLIGNSYLDWRGGGEITLSAATSGPYEGLIIVSDPNGPALTSTFHGNPSTTLFGLLNGSVYLPNQKFAITGNASIDLANTGSKLVAKSFVVTGSALVTLGSDDSLEIAAVTKNLRLVQ
jgi:Flp pilus assembly protein TadG